MSEADGITRRESMRRAGAIVTGSAAAYAGGTRIAGSPVQNGQAVAPLVLAGAAIAGGAVAGAAGTYLIGTNTDVFTGDVSVDGLENYTGGEALIAESYTRAAQLQGANSTTTSMLNNRIADSKNACWIDAKKAIVESINNGNTKAETEAAAETAVNKYYTTLQHNWIKHYNEATAILHDMVVLFQDHSDVSPNGSFSAHTQYSESTAVKGSANLSTGSYTLADGSTMDVNQWSCNSNYGDYGGTIKIRHNRGWLDTSNGYTKDFQEKGLYFERNGKRAALIPASMFGILDEIGTVHSDMVSNATTFANNTYDSYSAGNIDPTEIVDAQTFASEYAPDQNSGSAYAAAELAALGVDTNLNGEMQIRLEETGVQVDGVIAADASPEGGFEVGKTYDPANLSDVVYLSYDPTEGQMPLPTDHYQTLIDGGTLTFEKRPYNETVHTVHTTADESVELTGSDFTHDTTNDIWTVDLSDDLEEPITDVSEILLTYNGEKKSTLIELTEPFTILKFESHDGEEYSTATMSDYNQQTSDVSNLEEELEQLRKAREDFDKYEVQTGGGGFNFSQLGMFGLPGEAVAGGLAIVGGYLISN